MGFRVGVDIGGIFTDLVAMNAETNEIIVEKVQTTPEDPAKGFLVSINRFFHSLDIDGSCVDFIVHGTTVGTNALIQRKGGKTGLLTTEGFRDILEIGRHDIPKGHLYDPFFVKPAPLVPRNLRLEVPERVDSKGNIVREIDLEKTRMLIGKLKLDNVDAIAICLLFSWMNQKHEKEIRKLIEEIFPEAYISLSSEVLPEYREYERTSTTVVNAYLMPVMVRYLRNIEEGLRDVNIDRTLYVMQSSGGLMTSNVALDRPVQLIESGPAAGVVACVNIGKQTGQPNIISFDMGGTTAKAGLITEGVAHTTSEYEVGGSAHGRLTGTGYPIKSSSIDLVEVGAGGGSIAYVDTIGSLKVGPQSAGATPGPACYGTGGKDPTVTDANLILGRISGDYFLGGRVRLDKSLAYDSIQSNISEKLGITAVDAAYAIIRLANANMIRAIRTVSVERGRDPRNYALMCFGGAGPMHALEVAEELDLPLVMVPPFPGASSAYGFLMTDLRHDFVLSRVLPTNDVDIEGLNQDYLQLEEKGIHKLEMEEADMDNIVITRTIDMRYKGQSYEINLPVPRGRLSKKDLLQIVSSFHAEHHRLYGYSSPKAETQFVNLRLTSIGSLPKLALQKIGTATSINATSTSTRDVFFKNRGGFVPTSVYRRENLLARSLINGPAVVEEFDSTIIIHPKWKANVDEFGNLLITRQ